MAKCKCRLADQSLCQVIHEGGDLRLYRKCPYCLYCEKNPGWDEQRRLQEWTTAGEDTTLEGMAMRETPRIAATVGRVEPATWQEPPRLEPRRAEPARREEENQRGMSDQVWTWHDENAAVALFLISQNDY